MIYYKSDNGIAPWVIIVGRKPRFWFAYMTLWAAIKNYSGVWRKARMAQQDIA